MKILKGGNTVLESSGFLSIEVSWDSNNVIDVSSFMVDSSGKVPSDDYMVFYNQVKDPEESLLLSSINKNSVIFNADLSKLSRNVEKFSLTATLEDSGTFKDVNGLKVVVKDSTSNKVLSEYEVSNVSSEVALVLCEIYRNKEKFKFRAIGSGFNGGLAPLAESFGVQISEDVVVEPEEEKLDDTIPLTISLLKKEVKISLAKNNISNLQSRVAMVIDASGSMGNLYRKGTVQRAFERILAVASCIDDNGELDVWFFGDKCKRMPTVTPLGFEDYVLNNNPRPGFIKGMGYSNNEPRVIKDVLKKYVEEEPRSDIPTFVIFFSDGGVHRDAEIKKLITECSNKNIFWQFVGLGNDNFGVLEAIDDLPNRYLDNADFFALSDLDSVSDSELYNRIFNEFPQWLTDAKGKGLIN